MSRKSKLISGVILLICGFALIGWNLRDPDRGFREPPKEARLVTVEQVPLPVQSAIQRVSTGNKIERIKETRQGNQLTYEVDMIRGNTGIEVKFHEDGSIKKQKSRKLKPPASK